MTTFAYDSGVIQTITGPGGRVTGFEVDANGDLIQVTDAETQPSFYAYDDAGRIESFTNERGFDTTYDYGFAGQFAEAGFPDNTSISLSISKSLGLADLGIGLGTEGNPAPFGLPEDRMAEVTDGRGNTTIFRLDEFGQPVQVDDPIGRTTGLELGIEHADDAKPTLGDVVLRILTHHDHTLAEVGLESLEHLAAYE